MELAALFALLLESHEHTCILSAGLTTRLEGGSS